MLWRIYQALIAFAVGSANIYYEWTDNNYIVAAWCFMAAYGATVFPFTVIDWWRGRHQRRLIRSQKAHAARQKAARINVITQ